jgi:hypothetical protein
MQIAAFAGVERDEAGLAGGAVETSREMGGALGLALLVSVALRGTTNGAEVFHRSVLAAAVFAAAGAVVAIVLLRPAERPLPKADASNGQRGKDRGDLQAVQASASVTGIARAISVPSTVLSNKASGQRAALMNHSPKENQ